MPVLTSLTQFEQYDLETEVCDAVGARRETAGKIVAEVFVPEMEKRVRAAVQRELDAAIADLYRMHRIHTTPFDHVTEDDRAWLTAPAQQLIHGLPALAPFKTQLTDVGAWLRARSLRAAS